MGRGKKRRNKQKEKLGSKKEGIGESRSDVKMQSKQCNANDGNKKKYHVVKESREKTKKTVQQAGQGCCISTVQCISLGKEGNRKLSTFFHSKQV